MTRPTRPRRKPSLADVAERAGTSIATVSYVVNDGPRGVAPATRLRIETAITELGYRPNRVARALRSNTSNMIGLVVPGTSDAYFIELAAAVETAAFERGLLTLVGNAAFRADRESALIGAMLGSQIDGLVMIGLGESADVASLVKRSGVRCVSVHHRPDKMPGAEVSVDDAKGAAMAIDHLVVDHGHRSIACLTHEDDLGPVGQRLAAAKATMRRRKLPFGANRIIRSPIDSASASQTVQDWFSTRPRDELPTALFGLTDELALGALHGLWSIGLRVPDDVAVIGFDGVPIRKTTVPELATVVQPYREMGEAAVDLLVRGKRTEQVVVFEPELQPARSCGC